MQLIDFLETEGNFASFSPIVPVLEDGIGIMLHDMVYLGHMNSLRKIFWVNEGILILLHCLPRNFYVAPHPQKSLRIESDKLRV